MSLERIDSVAVIGSGNMGHGIAQVSAMAGYDVVMRDVEADLLADGYEAIEWSLGKLADSGRLDEPAERVLSRIETEVDLDAAVGEADLVIEAVPERMDLKREVFGALEEAAPADAILASNTSSLSITEIGAATDRPGQVVGTHFFNPPVKMDLVEVVHGERTSEETVETAASFVESVGKTPIHVRKDVRGFVVNNVLLPFMMEAAWMLSNGETTIREADAAMVYGRGYPMGPFELADLTGLDVGHDVYVEGDRPVPPALAERVEAGDLGQKTGQGYYDYDDGGAEYDRGDGDGFEPLRIEARMVNAAARLVGEGVATAEDVDTGMRLGAGFPEGICRRGDEIGLDAVLARLVALHQSTGEARYAPDPHLVDLVERGHTGADAGRGFFAYEAADREFEYLNREVNDGVLAVKIDRPDRHNALSVALRDEIVELFSGEPPEGVRCVTIEGAGDRAFSAGADISEFLDTPQTELLDVAPAFQAIADYPRPVIAKIDGLCLGGGFEVALACDLRIATERSTLGFPEIDLGLLPGGGGTQRLRRLVGPARTKELVFRGNHIDADRAASWGILNRAVPAEEFEATVESFLADLREGPPVALDLAKQVVDSGGDASLDASLRLESHAFGLLMGTDDATEGITAFMDDREPTFDGE